MATTNNASAPGANDYGGDEISALVLDPGFSTTRAGFAGEDAPKSVVPTSYGRTADQTYLFGDNAVHLPRPGMQILNPMGKDGTVEDWDTATKLWEYAITSRLATPKSRNPMANGLNDPPKSDAPVVAEGNAGAEAMDVDGSNGDQQQQEAMEKAREQQEEEQENLLAESPLLMTEPDWNSGKNREKAIEIAMEEWGCPAFWLAKSGVLSAFAAGKPTALVIDIGAQTASVTPVHDGLVLRKGVTKSPLGSLFISDQLRHIFAAQQPPITMYPHYLVSSKTPVDAGTPASATYRTFPEDQAPHASFRAYQEERLLTELKESIVQVWPGPGKFSSTSVASAGGTNEDAVKTQPGRPFEFPDGYNQVFGADRYRAAEGLFDAKAALGGPDAVQPSQTISQMVQTALSNVDVDVRPHLLANTVVTGGGSLTQGMVDRINQDMIASFPGPRVKIHAAGNLYERRFGPWIGGSILASLGSFHQMWISKKEYDEQGASIVEKRCK